MSDERAVPDIRLHQLVGELYVLPTRQKIVKMDRDEVLSFLREIQRARWDASSKRDGPETWADNRKSLPSMSNAPPHPSSERRRGLEEAAKVADARKAKWANTSTRGKHSTIMVEALEVEAILIANAIRALIPPSSKGGEEWDGNCKACGKPSFPGHDCPEAAAARSSEGGEEKT